ncbi:hypothetical protein [Raineya orbicola]|nr:hypothetical protein [Raineya orbicola]
MFRGFAEGEAPKHPQRTKKQIFSFSKEKYAMPRFFLSITTACILGAFLLAQTGIAVFKHSCKLKGEKTFIFAKPENICCNFHQNIPSNDVCHTLQNTACCIESAKFYKLSADFSINFAFAFDCLAHKPLLFTFEAIFLAYPSEKSLLTFQFANPPPKRFGKNLLQFTCIYLI